MVNSCPECTTEMTTPLYHVLDTQHQGLGARAVGVILFSQIWSQSHIKMIWLLNPAQHTQKVYAQISCREDLFYLPTII